jgi:Fe-S-cluster-containing dehydrogenase component
MRTIDRRSLFRLGAAVGAASWAAAPERSLAAMAARPGARGVLVDTTLCAGCRACEAACSEANHLPAPEDGDVFAAVRDTTPTAFTVVNKGTTLAAERYAKRQCLHCVDPACASGCVVRALEKTAGGPVIYHADRCLGCRYCMVVCPFGVPKYEYAKAAPTVKKCTFCAERQARGLEPACTSVCPTGALLFGERAPLLEEAKRRIYQNPGRYVSKIYGEEEAGGTSWLYLSDVPFETLHFRNDVVKKAYPELAKGALGTVPFVITLWPPLLMGLAHLAKRKDAVAQEEANHE